MTKNHPGGALLASVSRSFYLTIKALPGKLRDPIGLAYLLARATDTIADSADAPVETRLRHLHALRGMIETGTDKPALDWLKKEIVPAHAAECELIARLGEALAWLESQPVLDRADIVGVLRKITHGQELDLLRFGNAKTPGALKTATELDEYTYLVAGCVGEFWTQLCFRHLPGFTHSDAKTMHELGVNFGKGLQLVNILRDLPADLKAGRCYLPLDEVGLDGDAIRGNPALARAVFESWLALAVKHLDDAYRYIHAISHWRLRYACILPWILGVRTLVLVRENPPLENAERIKVSRGEVRMILVKALFWAASNFGLRLVRDKMARAYYCRK